MLSRRPFKSNLKTFLSATSIDIHVVRLIDDGASSDDFPNQFSFNDLRENDAPTGLTPLRWSIIEQGVHVSY